MLKKILICAAVLLIIANSLYFLLPVHFNQKFSESDVVNISYAVPAVSLANGTSQSDIQSRQFSFDKHSAEFKKIIELFDKYSYHRCFRTLTHNSSITGITYSFTISFSDKNGNESITFSNLPYIVVSTNTSKNFEVYKVGYFGNSDISNLCNELKKTFGIIRIY